MEYDIIGDIHGKNDVLDQLLGLLGYRRSSAGWSSPENRQILFVGDFIDRGEEQVAVVSTVRSLIEAGRAQAILGNHELNAIAWRRGFRPDIPKNRKQHQAFLDQVDEGSPLHDEMVDWFLTLPLWLDLPDLRVVHACWDPDSLDVMRPHLRDGRVPEELIEHATTGPSSTIRRDGSRDDENPIYAAVETLLKGVEVELPEGVFFDDKDGNRRDSVRVQWWKQQPATYGEASLSPIDNDEVMTISLPDGVLPGYDNEKPVFLGHYWRSGTPELLASKIACVDYSAGKGGPLVAYCWRGEDELSAQNFRSTLSGFKS